MKSITFNSCDSNHMAKYMSFALKKDNSFTTPDIICIGDSLEFLLYKPDLSTFSLGTCEVSEVENIGDGRYKITFQKQSW